MRDDLSTVCVHCGTVASIGVSAYLLLERVSFCSHECATQVAQRLLALVKDAPAKKAKAKA